MDHIQRLKSKNVIIWYIPGRLEKHQEDTHLWGSTQSLIEWTSELRIHEFIASQPERIKPKGETPAGLDPDCKELVLWRLSQKSLVLNQDWVTCWAGTSWEWENMALSQSSYLGLNKWLNLQTCHRPMEAFVNSGSWEKSSHENLQCLMSKKRARGAHFPSTLSEKQGARRMCADFGFKIVYLV